MSRPFELALTPGAVEALVERIAELVAEKLRREASPWMDRRAAADYLGMPLSRLEKNRTIPVYRDGRRVFYNRNDIDAYMAEKRDGGAS